MIFCKFEIGNLNNQVCTWWVDSTLAVTNTENQLVMNEKNDPLRGKDITTIHPCPVRTTLKVIGGKWKPAILWELYRYRVLRFGALRRSLAPITHKMLTQQLRELENDGIISRKVYAEVPPKVEYCLTERGQSLTPILYEMSLWGLNIDER